jgi:hypothetical protein
VAIPVVQLNDLGQIVTKEGLATSRKQKEQLPQTSRHAVDLVKAEFVRLSLGTFFVKVVEAVTATQITNFGNEMNEVDWHCIFLGEYLLRVAEGLKFFPKVHKQRP